MTGEAERDAALDMLDATRASLIAIGKACAENIYARQGQVTSVDVLAYMRAHGFGPAMARVDSRWAGCLWRGGGWVKVGYESIGSHARPCAVWRRKTKEGE